ncbi:MAG TPA: AtpZ/AtpI family protein [Acidobacteriota bacterium]|jgi:F0F1-type ATP synthase assembly protein I
MENDPATPERRRLARLLAQWSSIIFILPACLGVGFLIGYWADEKLGISPWMKIGGLLLGVAAGFYQLFRIIGKP